MNNLLEDLPEARAFCDSVLGNLDLYKLFPEEHFTHYVTGVLATSSVDAHGDILSEESLANLVHRVKDAPLWSLAEHNPLIHPIGRVIAAQQFFSPIDQEHLVIGVVGTYDLAQLPTFATVGLVEEDCISDIKQHDAEVAGDVTFRLGLTRHDLPMDVVAKLLATAPELIAPEVDQRFRKSLDLDTIIAVSLPTYLLLKTPLAQKLGERLGEKTADAVLDALTWLKTKLAKTVDAIANRKVLYELTIEADGCTIQFLIDTKDPLVVEDAIEKLPEAVPRAGRLLKSGAHLKIDKLVYLYDHRQAKKWLPLHAATRTRGVVTDRPYLVSLDSFKGFSIQGSAIEELIRPIGDAKSHLQQAPEGLSSADAQSFVHIELHEADEHLGHARLAIADASASEGRRNLDIAPENTQKTGYRRQEGENKPLQCDIKMVPPQVKKTSPSGNAEDRQMTNPNTVPRELIDIGIVIALEEEFEEFVKVAGPLHRHKDGVLTAYRFERSGYRLVAAFVGDMGEAHATRVTERMISTYEPHSVIVVGIAAAVHDDLKVGDVYVPAQAIQYLQDSKATPSKDNPDGFVINSGGPAYRADYAMLEAVRHLVFGHRNFHQRFVEDCATDLRTLFPDESARHRLFDQGLIRREVKRLVDAHVATGPVVGAAPGFSAWIRNHDRNIKALEMESAAVWLAAQTRENPVRALAIRGISDYGDTRKSELDAIGEKALRKYAMRNAVRFLWALLDANALPNRRHSSPRSQIDCETLPSFAAVETSATSSHLGNPGRLASIRYHTTPIYRAFTSHPAPELDWFHQLETCLTQWRPALESKLLYYGPGLARKWIALDGDPFSECGIQAFGAALHAVMKAMHQPTELEVVDIGVGSGGKARTCLQQLVRLHGAKRVGFVGVDISYEMLIYALESLFRAGEPIDAYGRIIAINADFNDLRGYRELLDGPPARLFLFLGNTLGNEPDEFRSLSEIRRLMRDGDILLLELQLLEDEPFTDEQLTEHIRRSKTLQFYIGPFVAIGCAPTSISVHGVDDEAASRGIAARTYSDICTFTSPLRLQSPFFQRDSLLIPKEVPVNIARKYRWPEARHLPKNAGFEIVNEVLTLGRDGRRKYVFFVLRRVD